MNIERIALILSITALATIAVIALFVVFDNTTPAVITPIKPEPIVSQNDIEFTAQMKGGMGHTDTITISGTVPTPNSSVTGMILHNEDEIDVTIVQVFQLTSDDNGFYTYDARINDDYLWKQDGKYTISIQNGEEYKKLYFYR